MPSLIEILLAFVIVMVFWIITIGIGFILNIFPFTQRNIENSRPLSDEEPYYDEDMRERDWL